MSETSFSTRHSGASITSTGGLNMVHLFDLPGTEVEVVDTRDVPVAVKVIKCYSSPTSRDEGTTILFVDWATAREIAKVVERRLEIIEIEGHPAGLRAL